VLEPILVKEIGRYLYPQTQEFPVHNLLQLKSEKGILKLFSKAE